MLARRLLHASQPRQSAVCLFCSARNPPHLQTRFFSATAPSLKSKNKDKAKPKQQEQEQESVQGHGQAPEPKQDGDTGAIEEKTTPATAKQDGTPKRGSRKMRRARQKLSTRSTIRKISSGKAALRPLEKTLVEADRLSAEELLSIASDLRERALVIQAKETGKDEAKSLQEALGKDDNEPMGLKEALLGKIKRKKKRSQFENLPIEVLSPDDLKFDPVEHDIPPVPRLSHGLDRVLFNPGVYRLQDPRSRVYNFDPYLEKIMPVTEFDFDALSEYKTSSKDEDLLAITRKLATKFTGSTSSMSGLLQHFHFLLSNHRELNHNMLSRKFPELSSKFSKITKGPSAAFLRWKDGLYAIDADKSFDEPNIMSWLGHSLEKLLTNSREEFERYRRSSSETAPNEDESGKCFHYSKLGNFLMRSQLDAYDSRLPGTGIFDLKTRAVVSIRMNHAEYEEGSGYQIRFDQGEWESYEREFYDMTRATMLKYSLQVRMGRMDGIFVAYHNVERMFGFQYLSLPDMDNVLHGQTDTSLGDQEFKLSIRLLDEILQRATAKFPETSLQLHMQAMEVGKSTVPYMSIFAVPVTEEEADTIQNTKSETRKEFERNVIGVRRDDPEVQAEWQDIQDHVDEVVIEEDMKAQDDEQEVNAKVGDEAAEQESREEQTRSEVSGAEDSDIKQPAVPTEDAPLMGWTLAVRNNVNGRYVDRPENLRPSDNWTIEYLIKEIDEGLLRKSYNQLRARREALIGEGRKERAASLQHYLEVIKKYSRSGRRWRQKQDEIDEEKGRQMFRPMGPGAEELLRRESGR